MGQPATTRQRYRILGKIAEGAVAEVFRARDEVRGMDVVLKMLRSELTTDRTVVGRFLDESRICQKLEHPGVVRHFASQQLPDGRVYLVTEALEGTDLGTQLRLSGPLSAEEVVQLALPLCEALEYVHQRGVVHRDIKPDNIFLEGGLGAYRPKLLDFGLAHFKGPRSVRTATGAIVASPEYTPPECIDGQKADARSDLYSLGILLFECLTGAPPFLAANYGELLLKHLSEPAPALPPSAAALQPIVHRLLAKAPADRFQSAGELAQALRVGNEMAHVGTMVSGPGKSRQDTLTEQVGGAGQDFGVYRTVSALGQGAMGTVYLARHTRLGRQVALKVLRPEHSRNSQLVQRFLQEARTVNAINHEHIVEIFDFAEDVGPSGEPRVYCVMELLTGASLSDLARSEPLPIARILNIARQISSALDAAHQVGVVHRDIKPDNIFVTERSGVSDYVKVLDFGVAKLSVPLADSPKVGTMAGQIIGTPAYMAPEQASGAGTNHLADIYAVGVVLYELLSARLPFTGEVFGKLVVQIMTHAPPPLPSSTPAGEPIPPALEELVIRLLAKNPAHRPQSMAAVSAELLAISEGTATVSSASMAQARALAAQVSDGSSQPAPKLSAPRSRALLAGLAVGILVLAGAGAWWALQEPPPAPPALDAAPAAIAPPLASPPPVPEVPKLAGISLRSTPEGAKVTRTDTGEELGLTPLSVALPRGDQSILFRLELAGYERAEREVRPTGDHSFEVPLKKVAAAAPAKPVKKKKKERVSDESTVNPFE